MAQLPHIWPGHDPKTVGLFWAADLRRKELVFLAKHGLNIEGYVGPLRALLAAFGPKISNPNGSMVPLRLNCWVGFGLMLGHLEATKNPRKILLFYACFFGRILEPSWAYIVSSAWAILGLCWALLALSGLKFQPQPKRGPVEVECWVGFGLMLGYVGLCWRLSGLKFQQPQRKHGYRWGWILGRFRAQNRLKTSCAIHLLIFK